MQVTMRDIWNSSNSFAELLNAKGLTAGVAIKIARMAKAVANELEILNGRRTKFLEDLGVKQENGTYQLDPSSENWDAFVIELDALFTIEVELEGISKVDIPAAIEIRPQVMLDLEPFIGVRG